MLKFHLITWKNRRSNEALLERYFRLRYAIYVVDRKWKKLDRPIPLELDEFDNENAIYLLGLDNAGRLCGGSRLIPTTYPHLLSEVFPVLADGTPPMDPTILEWSRFFVAPELRCDGRASPAAGMVLCALLEACLALGAKHLSVVCEAFWPERLERLGWRFRQLGPVLHHPDGDIVALLVKIDRRSIESTRTAYGFDEISFLDRDGDAASTTA